ncbi:MAG: hypothetical protein ABIH87_02520 [bacterium]
MNIKRALGFGVLLWIFIFVLWSIMIFLPYLNDHETIQYFIWWAVEIPLVLIMAKWYFKQKRPSLKQGFFLGLIVITIGVILDVTITVPLFVKSYSKFYGDWRLLLGIVEMLALTTLSGWEFDGPVANLDKD